MLFAIFTTRGGDEFTLLELEDFHSAAEAGLRIANEEGSRLSDIDICMDIPTKDETPQIGIFWRVQASDGDAILIVDCVAMAKAEIYGEFLTHGAHCAQWTKLAAMDAGSLRDQHIPDVVRWTEYEEWPRGRVVFHQPTGRFTIYADRKLQTPAIIADLLHRFSLPATRTEVRSDPHYISVR